MNIIQNIKEQYTKPKEHSLIEASIVLGMAMMFIIIGLRYAPTEDTSMKLYFVTATVNAGEYADLFVSAGSPRQAFELWAERAALSDDSPIMDHGQVTVWQAPMIRPNTVAGVQESPLNRSWSGEKPDDFPTNGNAIPANVR